MLNKVYKIIKLIGIIILSIFAIGMAVNWFMTYRLEDTLRKRLRAEIVKATNGFYDFSFDKLKVGLFTGELMIEGLAFYPDTAILKMREDSAKLPNVYINLYIDTLDLTGINLTWRFDYKELSFRQFLVKHPTIKITSAHKSQVIVADSVIQHQSLYESISPFFNVLHAKHINLSRADVEYVVKDSIVSSYSLKDLNFVAHNFLIDQHADARGHLLFSDYFDFRTELPQIVYDSEHFLLSVDRIRLSTMDSIVQISGANLQTKDKYWSKRLEVPGSYSGIMVGDVMLKGVNLDRQGTDNLLDARELTISKPNIEYYDVKGNEDKSQKSKDQQYSSDSLAIASWSLYTITSPLLERIAIENTYIDEAKLKYVQTQDGVSDEYTLNRLDFYAKNFLVDSLHRDYNVLTYVNDFSLKATNVQGHLASKNTIVDFTDFRASSIEKNLKLSSIKLSPISITTNKDYAYGKIEDFEITNINYSTGLDADLLYIDSPQLDYVQVTKKKGIVEKPKDNTKNVNELLDAITPFISYLSVKNIVINNANASFFNKTDNNRYQLRNLNFYAKNFHIDSETRRLRDYFFRWDEYSIKFKDFDNLTPDRKYRIQIKEGDFDSVSGDMILHDLKVTPEEGNTSSYINIYTPAATLLGLDEKGVRQKRISFKTFILDSPIIEIVKDDDHVAKSVEEDVKSIALNFINFDLLTIPSPSIYYYDIKKGLSAQVQSVQVHIDSFRWEMNKNFSIDNLIIESPYVSIVETMENKGISNKNKQLSIESFGEVNIRKINIKKPILKIKKPSSYLDFSAENYLMKSLYWNHSTSSVFEIEELDFSSPTLFLAEEKARPKRQPAKALTKEGIIKKISVYANKTKLGRINISDLNLRHRSKKEDGSIVRNKLMDTHLLIEKLDSDLDKGKLNVNEIAFRTKNIDYPIDSFYTLRVGDIDFSKRKGTLDINKVKLDPSYPKFDFAYIHPRGADWFDVEVDKISLSGIDASRFVTDTILLVKKMRVNDVLFENFKNQKIEIEHNIMPLLYEQFQQFPIKYNIDDLDIKNFTVIYEELAKNGSIPARIPFAQMNGRVQGFTNIQKNDNTFYTLHADGLAMGTGAFVAEWKIPVDSANDKFYLTAEIKEMDMRDFNQLVRPMAPAYVKSGRVEKLAFQTEATSLGAAVDMQFTYDSLYIVLLKGMDGENKDKMLTRVINRWGIEESNYGKALRTPHKQIVRDAYHSNFNYFWQILQPPLVESVGIDEKKQNLAHNLVVIFNRIKRFFGKGEKKEEKKEE